MNSNNTFRLAGLSGDTTRGLAEDVENMEDALSLHKRMLSDDGSAKSTLRSGLAWGACLSLLVTLFLEKLYWILCKECLSLN